MRKFTFIVEYRGGTYISQYQAINLMEALSCWADSLDSSIFANRVTKQIQEKVKEEDYFPVSVRTVDNVWCSSYTIARSLLLLNIIETV